MKTNSNIPKSIASTYALLVHSEENEGSVSETLVYALLIGSAVISMWYAAVQPFRLPIATAGQNGVIAQGTRFAQPAHV